MVSYLNNLESLPLKDASCQVWMKLAHAEEDFYIWSIWPSGSGEDHENEKSLQFRQKDRWMDR